MTVSPAYIPAPTQSDTQATQRGQALGVGLAPRTIPPVYQPYVANLPGVIAEAAGLVVYLPDNGDLTGQQITAAIAPLVTAEQAALTISANQQTIQQQAQTALVNNRAYLAIGSPTNAQVAAQVRALTQEVQGLIRLVLNQLDATN